jgi:AsmA-like C-terminal region
MSRRAPQIAEAAPVAVQSYHQRPSPGRFRVQRWWMLGVPSAVLLVAGLVLAAKWPFNQSKVIHELEDSSGTRVRVERFRKTLFPPGCIADNVTFGSDGRGLLVTIRQLKVQGSYAGMLHHYVPVIEADGAHIVLPSLSQKVSGFSPKRSETRIGKLVANGALLEIASSDKGHQPTFFQVHQFSLSDLGSEGPMRFATALTNPMPPGEIEASGEMGPWSSGDLGQTPISGKYSFRHAQLGALGGITGTLASDGKFAGQIRQMEVSGAVEVPDFQVRRSTHQVRLRTEFHARVNATNGDVFLQGVTANFGRTKVDAQGEVASRGHNGKTAKLQLLIPRGRIQDVLLLFISDPRSPMTGSVAFRAGVSIPGGNRPFLHKVRLEGDFGVGNGQFTNDGTQVKLNKLSAQARGGSDKDQDDPATVVSDLSGHVLLNDATATFEELKFRVPGALAKMHGTYNLESQRIDLHGILLMQQKLSNTTSGIKSFLLKPLEPFLKKNRRGGAKLAVSINGTYSHPHYSASPMGK